MYKRSTGEHLKKKKLIVREVRKAGEKKNASSFTETVRWSFTSPSNHKP